MTKPPFLGTCESGSTPQPDMKRRILFSARHGRESCKTVVTIPRGWYRAQKPLNPGNTKKYEKHTKSPTPARPPKIRKNYRKNTKMAKKLPFVYFFGIFFVFSGGDLGSGILYFCRIFFVFPGFRGFWALYHPRGIVKLW